jgi:plastocyanin
MKKLVALLALALASVALVACGSSSDTTTTEGGEAGGGAAATEGGEKPGGGGGGSTGGGSTVELEADPNGDLAYTTAEVDAKSGKVTVEFKNPQGLTHDVAIENENGEEIGKTELITESSTSTTVELGPGTYIYYCTVPGHREAGMEGTLVVK